MQVGGGRGCTRAAPKSIKAYGGKVWRLEWRNNREEEAANRAELVCVHGARRQTMTMNDYQRQRSTCSCIITEADPDQIEAYDDIGPRSNGWAAGFMWKENAACSVHGSPTPRRAFAPLPCRLRDDFGPLFEITPTIFTTTTHAIRNIPDDAATASPRRHGAYRRLRGSHLYDNAWFCPFPPGSAGTRVCSGARGGKPHRKRGNTAERRTRGPHQRRRNLAAENRASSSAALSSSLAAGGGGRIITRSHGSRC